MNCPSPPPPPPASARLQATASAQPSIASIVFSIVIMIVEVCCAILERLLMHPVECGRIGHPPQRSVCGRAVGAFMCDRPAKSLLGLPEALGIKRDMDAAGSTHFASGRGIGLASIER